MPKFVADLHTHSLACGHGFSTVTEVIRAAADKGLELVALTEHGPAYPGSVKHVYFDTYRDIPNDMFGIKVLRGCEANIIDFAGTLDFDDRRLEAMDIVIASFHSDMTPKGNVEQNTQMYISAMRNPRVDIIGHPDSADYPIDVEAVVKAAVKYNVALEINSSSPAARPGSESVCREIISYAKEHGALLSAGSDAHYHLKVGDLDYSLGAIRTIGYPIERVLNYSVAQVFDHLRRNSIKKSI